MRTSECKRTLVEKKVSVGRGKYQIDLSGIITNDGLITSIVGGEKPHVGAIAVSIPSPKLMDSSKLNITTSVLTLIGHKDDVIAKQASEMLARELKQTTVVAAGVHVERPSGDDIKKLISNSMEAVDIFKKHVKALFEQI